MKDAEREQGWEFGKEQQQEEGRAGKKRERG